MSSSPDAYDEVAYPTLPQPQTHPDRLAQIAWCAGLAPPLAEDSRVLELGSGDAANLAPMAYYARGMRATAVERSARAHGRAVARRDALGLDALTLVQGDLLDLEPEALGEHDYVIAHGLFSWVDEATRAALLRLAREALSPQGVLLLSYNARAAWGLRGSVRDAMRSATRATTDPKERVARARGVLDALRDRASSMPDGPFQFLKRELETLAKLPDAVLFHDLLADHNDAFTFHEIAERTEAAGLRWIGEMLGAASPVADAPLDEDERTREGMRDVLENRSLRMAVFARGDVEVTPRDPAGWARQGRLAGRLRRTDETTFEASTGARVRAGRPAMREALIAIAEAGPIGVTLDAIFARDEVTGADLARLVRRGHLEVRRGPPRSARTLGERPEAHAVVQLEAILGDIVPGPHHDPVPLDGLARFVAERCDGTRTEAQLVAQAAEALSRSVAELERPVRARLEGMLREGLMARG